MKSLRGDLDNIVLMALRKEPERRYSSVAQFSEDIRRHQEGLPVAARPNTFSYRAGKFIRRHSRARGLHLPDGFSLVPQVITRMVKRLARF